VVFIRLGFVVFIRVVENPLTFQIGSGFRNLRIISLWSLVRIHGRSPNPGIKEIYSQGIGHLRGWLSSKYIAGDGGSIPPGRVLQKKGT
jgi:hypothetical protein